MLKQIKRFYYSWKPNTLGECGCLAGIGIAGSLLILTLVLMFSILIRSIGWLWGF